MGVIAIVCNLLLVAFTCLVVVTDGISTEAPYLALTFLVLVVPTASAVVLFQDRQQRADAARGARPGPWRVVAAILNALLLVGTCAAIVDQYPHPAEPGFIPYVVVSLMTPTLSLVALLAGRRGRLRAGSAA